MKANRYPSGVVKVIFEDNHLIAINKHPGDLVHGDVTGDEPLEEVVKQYIKIRYNKPGDVFLGVIHRLDRPVSGVVVFARTSKALTRMNEMLRAKRIQKTYLAIVTARPDPLEGTLTHYIAKDETKNIVRAYLSKKPDTKEAVLHYRILGELDGKVLLEVKPITGRPHQIRVQLAKMGCPIMGDLKYGAEKPLKDKSIALHCREMSFEHPVLKSSTSIVADPPTGYPWNIFSYT